ncbi:hypothetical protein GCG54_00002846 [Colletotrichum gloeosporioides]|uniref:Uncharacterized protein n=1 Tax=Colletotrichum gloeosporioides TaxID=474922 RepID=A0A8H4CK89_COLGL|nr:uncharacterized protein GCG54_00002846 [Colletotrichum gloeosporioides]KAF3805500.1 hypothetical protein GCG54_00002846 [Colletotrichum gloeosporioides]
MPTSSTAAVCGFNQRSVEEKSTTPPLTPTLPEERPAIPVRSDPGYCIGRFLGSQQHASPPLSQMATSPKTTDDAEKAGRVRMAGILAEIGFPVSD